MKNLHLLPTEKSSRLKQNKITKKYSLVTKGIDLTMYTPQNIYITSDEEIKEGNWFMSDFNSFPIHNIKELSEREGTLGWEQKDLKNNLKIILTTDQDLIKNGVQAIDDEFIEWFVKNPSFEEVLVETVKFCLEKASISLYQIITPKEEPKQEKLEEVAERYYEDEVSINAFVNGAKWQQEQMYSELAKLRNELYEQLPIGKSNAFDLFKIINNHINRIDELI